MTDSTPNDELRELVEQLRNAALMNQEGASVGGYPHGLMKAADELEALLDE